MTLYIQATPMHSRGVPCYIDPKTGRYSWEKKSMPISENIMPAALAAICECLFRKWLASSTIKAPLEASIWLDEGHHNKSVVYEWCYVDDAHITLRYCGAIARFNHMPQ